MGKAILVMTFFGLSILLIFGIINPTSPVMWLASTSAEFAVLRAVLMVVLVAMFVTNPPRKLVLRVLVGVVCTGLAGWALIATYENSMKILDTMIILESTVTSGLMVLERNLHSRYLAAFRDDLTTYIIWSRQPRRRLRTRRA
jgi:hypothetical protein